MNTDLDVSAHHWLEPPTHKFFYQTIVDILRSSKLPDLKAKSRAIANSAINLCTSTDSREEAQYRMWQFWLAVGRIIPQVPHDHLWQDFLADAALSLRRRPEPRANFGKNDNVYGDWEDLPDLVMYMMDFRQGKPLDKISVK